MTQRVVPRSQLTTLLRPDAFLWATGIEDTFIAEPHPVTGRTMDEYTLTQHYERWEADLALVAGLAVGAARYGVPWYRIQPEPDRWDWTWADRPLERMLELGVDPIVDLVHYGTPLWMEGGPLHPDYPKRVAEYAARLAERFAGRIRWYTPCNEPRVMAWFCGQIGWWPPYRKSKRGFVDVLKAAAKGICLTDAALRSVDPEIVSVHVDAGDLFYSDDPSLQGYVDDQQEIVFAALDMAMGRVGDSHRLRPWLRRYGVTDADLAWFADNATTPDIVGVNMYPMFTWKRLRRSGKRIRTELPYATGALAENLCALYWERYNVPVMITETAAAGTVEGRVAWLNDSVRAVAKMRADGVPVIGYTWWPLFALVEWSYRHRTGPMVDHLIQMGMYDLDPETLDRLPTEVVRAYTEIVGRGNEAVGALKTTH